MLPLLFKLALGCVAFYLQSGVLLKDAFKTMISLFIGWHCNFLNIVYNSVGTHFSPEMVGINNKLHSPPAELYYYIIKIIIPQYF